MTKPKLNRLEKLEPLLVGCIVAAVYFLQSLSPFMQVGAFNDDGVYAVLGKAIAEGRGYVSLHLVGSPVHPKFPPVFPLILGLFWKITGSIQGVQRLVSVVHPLVIGLAAALLWRVGRERFHVPRALLAVFVVPMLLFDSAIQYYTIPLSEPWFILGRAAALFCWIQALQRDEQSRGRWLIAAGLFIAFTILVRSQGVSLLPAFAFALSRRDFKIRQKLGAAASAIMPLVAWYAYHSALLARGPRSHLPDDITYDTWMRLGLSMGAVLSSIATNISWYVHQFGSYFTSIPILGITIASVLFAAMIAACVVVAGRAPMVGIPVLIGVLLVLMWPFAQDRLLLCVLPFAGLALAVALAPYFNRLAFETRRMITIGAAATVIAFTTVQAGIRSTNVTAFAAGTFPATYSPGFMLLVNSRFVAQASAWIRANTPRNARVMVDNHPGIYLYSGRATMPANPSESRMQMSVFEKPGRYLASHILRDSITTIVIGEESDGIMRDVSTIKTRCPEVLSWGGVSPNDPQTIMAVHPDPACLAKLAE
jgi:hypothetical protein